jgi:hypothetical protein
MNIWIAARSVPRVVAGSIPAAHGIITFILNRCRPQGKLKNSPAASNQRNGRIRGSIADAGYFRGLAGNMDFA